jgi:hypothetical protein
LIIINSREAKLLALVLNWLQTLNYFEGPCESTTLREIVAHKLSTAVALLTAGVRRLPLAQLG